MVLQVDVPTFVDMQAAVCGRRAYSRRSETANTGAVIGRGSGKAYQLALSGTASSSCRRPRGTRRRLGLTSGWMSRSFCAGPRVIAENVPDDAPGRPDS